MVQRGATGRIQNMDRGPWTTSWTTPWTCWPPLIFKRKSPLSILYENLPKVRVWKTQTLIYCLHSWGFVSYKCLVLGSRPYEWEDHKLVLRYRRSSEFLPPIFSFQHFQIAIRSGRHLSPPSTHCLLDSIVHKNEPIYYINEVSRYIDEKVRVYFSYPDLR